MYYTYSLVGEARREHGIVGYQELPDLIYDFSFLAKKHGAITTRLEDGSLVALKGTLSVSLSIGEAEESFPCRSLGTCMADVISETFCR